MGFNMKLCPAIELKGLGTYEPQNLLLPYANNKGADQPAQPLSLISTFVVHYLDSTTPILANSKISRLFASEQAGLSLTWLKNPKTGFLLTKLILCNWSSSDLACPPSFVMG